MKILKEFRDFAVKGNVVDLAIGVIIGASFGKIVTSFVSDIIMPPIGFLMGNVNLADMFITLSKTKYDTLEAAKTAGAVTINIGVFLSTIIDFLIVALVIFLIVKKINQLKRKPQPQEPNTKDCPYCLSSVPIKATKCAFCTSELK